MPVQLRFPTGLSSDDYIRTQAWTNASLTRCPLHPYQDCGMHRHGTYERKGPAGAKVTRYYCRKGQTTFSLLPDCLAARLPDTLDEVQQVIVAVEVGPSIEQVAAKHRPVTVSLPSAVRWVRRRLNAVRAVLMALIGLLPGRFAGCQPTIKDFTRALGTPSVLVALRGLAPDQLALLATPVGFRPAKQHEQRVHRVAQHAMGPDPPESVR